MIAIELYVNDKKVATAGVAGGVMSAIVNLVGVLKDPHESDEWHSSISLAGLNSQTSEHLRWFSRDLSIGDEVRIRIIESDVVDTPTEREPHNKKLN
jgi:hypothetical protein